MMKTQAEKENVSFSMSKQARLRLEELKTAVRANGVSFGKSTPGKLIEKLILAEDSLESLKKAFNLE